MSTKSRFARDYVLCVLACAVGLVTIVGPSSTSAAITLNASDFASADVVEPRVVVTQTVVASGVMPQLATGGEHSCVLDRGAVKCWGDNNYGQLGLGDRNERGDEDGEMGAALLAVDLGSGVTASAISAGNDHTCALTSVGVKCWGNNSYGQLGLGTALSYGGSNEMGDTLPSSYQFARTLQMITFSAIPDREYSTSPFTVTATSDSTLAVTLTSSTQSVCGVSGFQVTMLTTGTCTLVASQAGDVAYSAASVVSRSFAISEVSTTTVPVTTTTVPGTTTNVPVITTTVPAAANVSSAPSLPQTGSNSTSPLGAGVLALLGGVVLMASRRRTSRRFHLNR